MRRNNRNARRGVDGRLIIFLIISVMIVITMILAYFPVGR